MSVSEVKLDKYVLNDWFWGTKMETRIHSAVFNKMLQFSNNRIAFIWEFMCFMAYRRLYVQNGRGMEGVCW